MIPNIPEDLLKFLDETYPERCPDPQSSERQIWMQVGARSVVRHLKRLYQEQNDNLMESTNVLGQNSKDAYTS